MLVQIVQRVCPILGMFRVIAAMGYMLGFYQALKTQDSARSTLDME